MRTSYASDLSDEQWALIEPLIPPEKPGGRHRTVNLREVINAILYLVRTGCQWRLLPHEFPPRSTVNYYFRRFSRDGTWDRIMTVLRRRVRQKAGRRIGPRVAIIDSQTVKTTEKGGLAALTRPRGSSGGSVIWSWTPWGCRCR